VERALRWDLTVAQPVLVHAIPNCG
jgi:hypothetical protein